MSATIAIGEDFAKTASEKPVKAAGVKKPGWLKIAFLSACALLGTGGTTMAATLLAPNGPARHLTTYESNFLRSIFGEDFRTDNIRIQGHNFPMPNANAWVFPGSNKIDVWHAGSTDEFTGADRESFLGHEATHIYQNRTMSLWDFIVRRQAPEGEVYSYEIMQGKPFADYGIEQQAQMVGDYIRHFISRNDVPEGSNIPLRDLVEGRFPAARITRIARDAERASIAICAKDLGEKGITTVYASGLPKDDVQRDRTSACECISGQERYERLSGLKSNRQETANNCLAGQGLTPLPAGPKA